MKNNGMILAFARAIANNMIKGAMSGYGYKTSFKMFGILCRN